ncbi:unnamed protein product [Lepidochelys kempii]
MCISSDVQAAPPAITVSGAISNSPMWVHIILRRQKMDQKLWNLPEILSCICFSFERCEHISLNRSGVSESRFWIPTLQAPTSCLQGPNRGMLKDSACSLPGTELPVEVLWPELAPIQHRGPSDLCHSTTAKKP